MTLNPYSKLPSSAFWKTAIAQASPFKPFDFFKPKWKLEKGARIATAGSCFAQHVTRALRSMDFEIVDVEPPTLGLAQSDWLRFGYGMYSARYGNVYTAQQLLSISKEALCGFRPGEIAWSKGDRFVDAMRPAVEPDGLSSPEEVIMHRAYHLEQVRQLFLSMDVFIFTLGLTEGWVNANDGATYPMSPGTIAGCYDKSTHQFRNFGFEETLNSLSEFRRLVLEHRAHREFRMILTVSPVPLTATATDHHVLLANSYSKAVLRAVSGEFTKLFCDVDYFPSFEIFTNPAIRSMFYEDNLRTVRQEGVKCAMEMFLRAYSTSERSNYEDHSRTHTSHSLDSSLYSNNGLQCEEYLLEAFGE